MDGRTALLAGLVMWLAGCGASGGGGLVAPEQRSALDADVVGSPVIVRATALAGRREVEVAASLRYQVVPFQVRRVYRAPADGLSAYGSITTPPEKWDQIFVVALAYTGMSEFLVPRFDPGKDYILYLEMAGPFLYARTLEEHFKGEHP